MAIDCPIAVVGMGGIFPGAADLAAFWSNIRAGRDLARDVPPGRWALDPREARSARSTSGEAPADCVASLRGCFVEDFALDADGLRLDAALLHQLDPVNHFALHAGRAALQDARLATVDRDRVGVILAAIALPTDGASAITRDVLGGLLERRLRAACGIRAACSPAAPGRSISQTKDWSPLDAQVVGLPAALVAQALELGGGTYTLDAACASSLYALKLACDELAEGRADAMLAGGVSRPDCLYTQMGFTQLRALSPSGRCAPFDESADGLLVGEGAGVVVLRRLADAVRDGQNIYAVIRGIGLSNDIGGSLLAPDSEGQLRAMRQAYQLAGWRPDEVDLIECHGTGTPTGDAVEIDSLRALWADCDGAPGRCPIGSVKSMIGHLLTAAGAAGLIKTLLAMREGVLPPQANYSTSAPSMNLVGGPFRVQTEPRPWLRRDENAPRRAAVSAFGFGGINAHVLIEEFVDVSAPSAKASNDSFRAKARGRPATADLRPDLGFDSMQAASKAPHDGVPHHRTADSRAIAVVGMAARFGTAADLGEFAEAVRSFRPLTRPRPKGRWMHADEAAPASLRETAREGAFLDSIEIPVGRYRLPPNEVPEILPQQLLMLDVAAAALADARMPLRERRPDVGVIIGMAQDMGATNFHLRWWLARQAKNWARELGLDLTPQEMNEWLAGLREAAGPALNAARTLGALGGVVASRIAREMQLGGPSFGVSCDAASGLVALDIALRALRRGEISTAVVGAVDLAGDMRIVLSRGDNGIAGEGAGAVVLKRFEDARRDGDRVHAVILGIGRSGGGRSTSGNGSDSAADRALQSALADAGVEADSAAFDESGLSSFESVARIAGQCGAATGMAALLGTVISLRQGRKNEQGASATLEGVRRTDDARRRACVGGVTGDRNVVQVILEEADPELACSWKPPDDGAGDALNARARERSGQVIRVEIGGRIGDPPPPPRWSPVRPSRSAAGLEPVAIGASGPSGSALADHRTLRGDIERAAARTAAAHDAYLHFSEHATRDMASALAMQAQLLEAALRQNVRLPPEEPRPSGRHGRSALASRATIPPPAVSIEKPGVVFNRAQCLEFARGKVANVLGPEFAVVDGHPTRVRLPDEPLMLVDRILTVEGVPRSLARGRLVTEHDVRPGAWYLDGDRAPICISVEAGQADLFLSGYLGIDFATHGRRMYRLLDATVTFHRGLPRPGETIRYDIRIDRFVRQGETYLFFFEFDGTIDGAPVLTMRKGCAGFFSPEDIAASHGLVLRPEDHAPQAGKTTNGFSVLAPVTLCFAGESASAPEEEVYDDGALEALRRGDLAGCFGPAFDNLGIASPLRLPGGPMKLIDRVTSLNLAGGRFGLGEIVAEADIHPDDWFLTCHFVDDMVMPGTLMYECCAHALRFLLLRMGWIGAQDRVRYEPVPGVGGSLRCRGPVTPLTKKASYQVTIKEIGYRPADGGVGEVPYAIADALMYADGAAIVQMTDMSLQLTGLTREEVERTWSAKNTASPVRERPAFSREQILEFAVGKPSACFGAPYAIFDGHERRVARLPGPPYQFLDRVVRVEPTPMTLKPGGWIHAEYDVPPDAWYFAANRQPTMPFAVLLEVALQPCGFLAAYAGSALTSDHDLSFRNLGGAATIHREVWPDSGRLDTRVRMTNVSRAGGMIIESFEFIVSCADRLVYDGTTTFGFFSREALARQVGIRDAAERIALPDAAEVDRSGGFDLPDFRPFLPMEGSRVDGEMEGEMPAGGGRRVERPDGRGISRAQLPARAFRMIDRVEALAVDGGSHGLGFVVGSTIVDPAAWFFGAHFYQDPVWPGSLGLESLLQLLKVYTLKRRPDAARTHRFEPIAVGLKHEWQYRGQVIPTNRRAEVTAVITRREDGPSPLVVADGILSVDGIIIYEMKDFGLRLIPSNP